MQTSDYKKFKRACHYGSHVRKLSARRLSHLSVPEALVAFDLAMKKFKWLNRFASYMEHQGFSKRFSRHLADAAYDAAGVNREEMTPEEWADEEIYAMST